MITRVCTLVVYEDQFSVCLFWFLHTSPKTVGSVKGKTERCVCSQRQLRLQGLNHWYVSVQWEVNEGEVGKGHNDTQPLSPPLQNNSPMFLSFFIRISIRLYTLYFSHILFSLSISPLWYLTLIKGTLIVSLRLLNA